jgi:hypothetical protein
MIAFADELVVVGDSVPWSRLARCAHDAGIPVRFYPGTPGPVGGRADGL